MRVAAPLVVALSLAACTATPATITGTVPSTTVPIPTTTTTAVTNQELCDRLKIASFDLQQGVADSLPELDQTTTVDEEANSRAMLTAIIAYYDTLGDVAATATDEVGADLTTMAGSVGDLRSAIESGDPVADALSDPSAMQDPEAAAAAERLVTWGKENCQATFAFAVEGVILQSAMAAVMQAFGSTITDLGQTLADAFSQGLSGAVSTSGLTYGDDPALDALWDQCESGSGEACEDLWFQGTGVYEFFGQTCGRRIAIRSASGVDCNGKLGEGGPVTYGDDFFLDGIWDGCKEGDDSMCDQLYGSSPLGSDYEAFGSTCGDRLTEPSTRPCVFITSGGAFEYGDDADLDALWDACSTGDGASCNNLFFEAPVDSEYEAFGDVCGSLLNAGKDCDLITEWLGGPVG
jgi:hypothetical protein